MYYLNNNRNHNSRKRVIGYFTPQIGGGQGRRNNVGSSSQPFQTPGSQPTADGTSLNTPLSGLPTSQTRQQMNPSTSRTKLPATTAIPSTKAEVERFQQNNKKSGTGKGKKNQKKKDKYMQVFRPREKKPNNEPEITQTSRDNVPSGQQFYENGPRISTSSVKLGKLGTLPTLKQTAANDAEATTLGQIRCLIQVVTPAFFNQYTTNYSTTSMPINDVNLDDTHTQVFRHQFQQLRNIYEQLKNINLVFETIFSLDNVYIYFYDTFALFAELVCLIQGAAYYINKDGCDNKVLAALGNTLNKEALHDIRNEMARTLRFCYLPDFCIEETYEMFQTYRVGRGTTSGSLRYVTPSMARLMRGLGDAGDDAAVATAISDYIGECNILIDKVKNGRVKPATPGTKDNRPQRIWVNDAENTQPVKRYILDIFDPSNVNTGILSSGDRNTLETYFSQIKKGAGISLLNNLPRGNSETLPSQEWSDMWNNQQCMRDGTDATNIRLFPNPIVGGAVGSDNKQTPPGLHTNTIYCSETPGEDITFKQTQFMLQRFTGYAPLLWRLDHVATNINSSRWYLEETAAKPVLTTMDDVLFIMKDDVCRFDTGFESPFTQNNYVTKLFRSSNQWKAFSNPDGTSEGMWYLTLGYLRDAQYNVGIDLLSK